MQHTAIRIGPGDHGRRMTLAEFEHAEGQEGRLYELSRGVVTVVDVPDFRHLSQVNAARVQFYAYVLRHPGRIHSVASGGECKILLHGLESERHPDLAIYKSPPADDEDYWATWIPEIVIEVVSRSSRHRDFEEKPDEYLQFGIREYWILDAERDEMVILKRFGGRWVRKSVRPPETHKTRLLPDFEFDCGAVFKAAGT